MTEHAIVTYPPRASRRVKIDALYAGLETIAVRLMVDYGQPLANVLAGLERAGNAARGES